MFPKLTEVRGDPVATTWPPTALLQIWLYATRGPSGNYNIMSWSGDNPVWEDDYDSDHGKIREVFESKIIRKEVLIKLEDIVGQAGAKKLLQAVLPQLSTGEGLLTANQRPCHGVLLSGRQTDDKRLVDALADAARDVTFIAISGSDIVSNYVGMSERRVRNLFALAGDLAPTVIYFDKLHILATRASHWALSELLKYMRDLEKQDQISVVGATNFPWTLNSAILQQFQPRIDVDSLGVRSSMKTVVDTGNKGFCQDYRASLELEVSHLTHEALEINTSADLAFDSPASPSPGFVYVTRHGKPYYPRQISFIPY